MNTKNLQRCVIASLFAVSAHATVLMQFDFNDALGTELQQTSPTVGSSWASSFAHPVSQVNGSGKFVITGAFASTDSNPLNTTFNTATQNEVYELVFSGVTFQNLSGNDFLVFAYRTGASGTVLPGSSTTRAWMKFGDFDGGSGLDIESGPTVSDTDITANNLISTANTFDFIAQWDTANDKLRFYYNAGSGRVQVGSEIATVNGTISHIGMYANVSDGGTGDSISIDGISLTVIPEPGTLALVGIALGSLLLFRRKR
jgi:hypothetical protein